MGVRGVAGESQFLLTIEWASSPTRAIHVPGESLHGAASPARTRGLALATHAATGSRFGLLLGAAGCGLRSTCALSTSTCAPFALLTIPAFLAAVAGAGLGAIGTFAAGGNLRALAGAIDVAGQKGRTRSQSSNNHECENQILGKKQLHMCPPKKLPSTFKQTLLHKPCLVPGLSFHTIDPGRVFKRKTVPVFRVRNAFEIV
jgi:hypothetical protein